MHWPGFYVSNMLSLDSFIISMTSLHVVDQIPINGPLTSKQFVEF